MKLNKLVCFSKGTRILLQNEELKNIENINIGDIIATYNSERGNLEFCNVEKIASSTHSVVNKIYFANGIELVSTPDHPYFVVNKGYCSVHPYSAKENYNMEVQELLVGDECLYYNKEVHLHKVKITKIETYIEEAEMYVISGGRNNNFFANGIVVSDENILSLDLEPFGVEYESVIKA